MHITDVLNTKNTGGVLILIVW